MPISYYLTLTGFIVNSTLVKQTFHSTRIPKLDTIIYESAYKIVDCKMSVNL